MRSASYSTASPGDGAGRPRSVNLNNSFPGTETVSHTPYISSSVTLPVAAPPDPLGFYHNVSGRIRQPSLRLKEEARNSFSRQADLHKSPRTQELEEFAAKFEGYQKQRTRRLATQPTPLMDQLARETAAGQAQLWQLAHPDQLLQLSTLETNLLKLVQRNDSRHQRHLAAFSDDNSSGRESVTTVISNSSSETVKLGSSERHSSSETLRYCDTEAGDTGEAGPHEAVRTRTMSICDEMFLGHGYGQGLVPEPSVPDNNYNSWRTVKQRSEMENNNGGYWDMNGGHQNGYGTVKRALYRSHSEAGTALSRNEAWPGDQETLDHAGTTWHDLGEVGGPRDPRGQMLDYLARDEVTGRWLAEAQQIQHQGGDNWPPAAASSGEAVYHPTSRTQELPSSDTVSTVVTLCIITSYPEHDHK